MIVLKERVPRAITPLFQGRQFEKQYIECKATGGSLQLTFRGATTQPIAYDASSIEVKRALEALHTIGSVSITGDVFCVPPCATCSGPNTCSSDAEAHKACDIYGYPLNVGNFSVEFTSGAGRRASTKLQRDGHKITRGDTVKVAATRVGRELGARRRTGWVVLFSFFYVAPGFDLRRAHRPDCTRVYDALRGTCVMWSSVRDWLRGRDCANGYLAPVRPVCREDWRGDGFKC